MSRARGLLVLAIVSSAAACTFTASLDGLTGAGGGDAGSDVASEVTTDVAPDTTTSDGPSTDSRGPGDGSPDVTDGPTGADASDGGPAADVAQPDVGTGPVSCADAGVLLCEDFENGLDTIKWPTTDMNSATVAVDGTQHHRGANALHANVPALTTDGSAVNVGSDIRHYVALPSPVFVRAFVMFSSAQPEGTEEFMVAQQNGSPYYGLQLELNTGNAAYALTDWTVSPTYYAVSTLGAAAMTWNCVEWELDPPASGTATTTTDVWVNGTEVSSLHLTNTPMSDLGLLGFGVGFYQVTSLSGYDVWIDDIYVDTQRVGCDK